MITLPSKVHQLPPKGHSVVVVLCITGTARYNQLSMEIFEALQILKSAYQNGHIAAVNQAAQDVDMLIMELEGLGPNFEEEDL